MKEWEFREERKISVYNGRAKRALITMHGMVDGIKEPLQMMEMHSEVCKTKNAK